MAEKSAIEWTDATWNPITGCTLVSEGCKHCYAATLAATRLKNHPSRQGLARLNAAGEAKFTGEVRFNAQWLEDPLRWKKPKMIFVCAHGDLFHENVPDEWIDKVFAVMALAGHHTFQVLTKRPERAREYMDGYAAWVRVENLIASIQPNYLWNGNAYQALRYLRNGRPLPNVWLGTSIENQATADERIPHIRETPAAVRFVSAEPLLGPVILDMAGLDWVIVGGESGKKARPMHPDWPRSVRDQCAAAGVPFFFKQWGEWHPMGQKLADGTINGMDKGMNPSKWRDDGGMVRVGKKRAGRRLDGQEWNEVPGKT